MKPDDLLLPVPSFEQWMDAVPDRWHLAGGQVEPLLDAYFDQFRVQLPVLAPEGDLTVPPDEHILDAVARAWLPIDEEAASWRAEAGTVAVVADLTDCDLCGDMAARYETYVERRGTRMAASLCVGCQVRAGDPVLGIGHSVLMLLPDEVPDRLCEKIVTAAPERSSTWRREAQDADGWEAFRRWGFAGPDAEGRLHALILGVQLQVRCFNSDAVQFRVRRPDPNTWFINDGDVDYRPACRDELDVREVLVDLVRDHVPTRLRSAVRAQFGIGVDERDRRALRFMHEVGFERWLCLGEHPVCPSSDWSTAKAAASEGHDPDVLYLLVTEHPEPEIRRRAAGNPACSQDSLSEALRSGDPAVRTAAVQRLDLSQANLRELITQVLIDGRLDVHLAIEALVRQDFPEDLVERTADRIAGEGTDARILMANALHEAPPGRRDRLHLRLLQNSRRIKSTVSLVGAVIGPGDGPQAERLSWLEAQKSARIRDHVADFRDQVTPGAQAGLACETATPEPDGGVTPMESAESDIPQPADAAVVAARLRRWWLGAVPLNEFFVSSDLADAHAEITVRRIGNCLELLTPYDFGMGDPLDGDLGRILGDRVRELSGNSVTTVISRYDPTVKPPRRNRTSDLDIYAPGDPPLDQYDQLLARLQAAVPSNISDEARALLGRIRLAATSKHRVWFVVASADDRRAIGTTPNASWALNAAVRKLQGGAEPLYRVLVDPYLAVCSECI